MKTANNGQFSLEVCILAGGLSSRMGQEKSLLRLGRRTLLGHIRATARQLGFPTRVIRRDCVPRSGPIGGIYTALRSTKAEAVLFLACDMPFVPPDFLQKMVRRHSGSGCAWFAREGGRAGFPFLLRREKCLPLIERQIARADFSLQSLAKGLKAKMLPWPGPGSRGLTNINTPADLAVARKTLFKGCLSKTRPIPVMSGMLKRFITGLILTACGLQVSVADVLQLKDKASLTGKILAEKHDQVVLDIGYTVLVIPRNQIVKISKAAEVGGTSPTLVASLAPIAPSPASAPIESRAGDYHTASTPLPIKDVRELVSQLGESVVQVRTPGGLGSGFIINEDGFLITNFHVIEGETQISVEVYLQKDGQLERKSYKDVKIIAMNKFEDMALLKINDNDAPKFSRVLLGDSDALAVGEKVFAIGSPLGLERTVTEGILSTKTRELGGDLYLQTTAQINPGNSGGPLFNMRGEVVGITNMKITFGEGLGFAIPIGAVKFFLDHRDAFA